MPVSEPRARTDRLILAAFVLLLIAASAVFALLRSVGGQQGALVTDRVFVSFLTITVGLLALALVFILIRNFAKLIVERRRDLLGSRFRTKLVFSFVGLCLIPSVGLFYAAITVMDQTIEGLFQTPVEELTDLSRSVADSLNDLRRKDALRASRLIANEIARQGPLGPGAAPAIEARGSRWFDELGVDFIAVHDARLEPVIRLVSPERKGAGKVTDVQLAAIGGEALTEALAGRDDSALDRLGPGHRVWGASAVRGAGPGAPAQGVVAAGYWLGEEVASRTARIASLSEAYHRQKALREETKRLYILFFLLLTLLIMLSASWLGVYLARQITVPIEALAVGTRAVAGGDLDYRVTVHAGDEVGVLIDSFNRMTQDLQRKGAQLEERSRAIETLLENVPAGVIALDPEGLITSLNRAAARLLGLPPTPAGEDPVGRTARGAFASAALTPLVELIEQGAGAGGVSDTRELTLAPAGRSVTLAATVSPYRDAEGRPLGALVVLEDLTQLIRGQKSAAWREAARRVAHEIRNPLTPIQLSAQRILKKFREGAPDLPKVIEEGAAVIVDEVASLQGMVDEFSRFARMPPVAPAPCDPILVLESAVSLYDGTRPGLSFARDYDSHARRADLDPEQMKRALINLIDNAISAMEGRGTVTIRSRRDAARRVLRIEVADEGPGIAPADRERLFLPYFSTKKRGTGLGLAIVNRIVSDHGGTIHVEDNIPRGARFVIEIPDPGGADEA